MCFHPLRSTVSMAVRGILLKQQSGVFMSLFNPWLDFFFSQGQYNGLKCPQALGPQCLSDLQSYLIFSCSLSYCYLGSLLSLGHLSLLLASEPHLHLFPLSGMLFPSSLAHFLTSFMLLLELSFFLRPSLTILLSTQPVPSPMCTLFPNF